MVRAGDMIKIKNNKMIYIVVDASISNDGSPAASESAFVSPVEVFIIIANNLHNNTTTTNTECMLKMLNTYKKIDDWICGSGGAIEIVGNLADITNKAING